MANKLILLGRLTKEPELVSTNGTTITNFTLAVRREGKKDESDFINCKAFNTQAENIAKYVHKGNRLYVEGKLQSRTYQNKEGKNVTTWECIVNSFELVENKPLDNETQENNTNTQNEEKQAVETPNQNTSSIEVDEDSLPF